MAPCWSCGSTTPDCTDDCMCARCEDPEGYEEWKLSNPEQYEAWIESQKEVGGDERVSDWALAKAGASPSRTL